MIEVSGLRKVYRGKVDVVAVEDVSFSAEAGQIFGLLGPNGAGKTTTLRIIATVLKATQGDVRVAGVSAANDPQGLRRKIGFLSASTGLYDRLTPRELIEYFGRLNGLSDEHLATRIGELSHMLEIDPFLERPCGLLSTGQKQKVSIARALVHDPPVLIFDEPTSGLDVLVARSLIEAIERLRDARRTILLSTHIMAEAERLCDAAAIIHRGRIRASGTLDAIKAEADCASLEDAFFALIDREPARG